MANNQNTNQAAAQPQQPKFSEAIQTKGYQKLIHDTLQCPNRANRFIASILSAYAVNPDLQGCDAGTILAGGLLGEALGLSPSPQLGQYYLVPFEDNKHKRKVATFQLGYKGYIQLAIRSGQYLKLNVVAIKKDELIKWDELNEEIEVNLISDPLERENAETTGYYAMFKLTSGFIKCIYWSREQMQSHALRYSKAYAYDNKNGCSYSFWTKNFDGMGFKTMLRQLISKWGVMSPELLNAYERDTSVIHQDGSFSHIDNDDIPLLPSPLDNGGTPLPVDNNGENQSGSGKNVTMKDLQ